MTTTNTAITSNESFIKTVTIFVEARIKDGWTSEVDLVETMRVDPLYCLAWAERHAITVAKGRLYQAAQEHAKGSDETLLSALRRVVETSKDRLIGNELRGASSSAFSNAVEAAEREALSRFVRENQRTLERASERGLI